jgi:hypothetical protein
MASHICIYTRRQFHSRNGPVKAKFAFLRLAAAVAFEYSPCEGSYALRETMVP